MLNLESLEAELQNFKEKKAQELQQTDENIDEQVSNFLSELSINDNFEQPSKSNTEEGLLTLNISYLKRIVKEVVQEELNKRGL